MKTIIAAGVMFAVIFEALLCEAQQVIHMAAGYEHSLFVRSDGTLWAMGYNGSGQLGDGTYNNTNRPELIEASNITAVAAGYYHSMYISNNTSLWAMGDNYQGDLGNGSPFNPATNRPVLITPTNVTAIAAGAYHGLFISNNS